MTRPAPDGFWRQRVRGVGSVVLVTGLALLAAAIIASIALVVTP